MCSLFVLWNGGRVLMLYDVPLTFLLLPCYHFSHTLSSRILVVLMTCWFLDIGYRSDFEGSVFQQSHVARYIMHLFWFKNSKELVIGLLICLIDLKILGLKTFLTFIGIDLGKCEEIQFFGWCAFLFIVFGDV